MKVGTTAGELGGAGAKAGAGDGTTVTVASSPGTSQTFFASLLLILTGTLLCWS